MRIINYTNKKIFNNKFTDIKVTINVIIMMIVLYGVYQTKIYKLNIGKINFESILVYIFVGILLSNISIFVHELGHYLISKLLGINLKLFIVGPNKYIKDKNKKIIRFRFLGPLMTGGLILNEINNEVNDQSSLKLYTNKYIKILYGGPIFTLTIIIVSSIFIIANKFTIICMIVLVTNWIIFINIFYSNVNVYGDYCLIDLLKEKPEFIISTFSNQFPLEYPVNDFIIYESEVFVDKMLLNGEYNNLILALINRIIDIKIIREEKLSIESSRFKDWMFNYYFEHSTKNLMVDAKIIKVAYKLLLHEYCLTKNELKIDNYKSFKKFINLMNYNNYKYLNMLDESLKGL